MFLEQRTNALVQLGERLKSLTEDQLVDLCNRAGNENAWFTPRSVRKAVEGTTRYLNAEALGNWLSKYELEEKAFKNIGVVAAGNIPLVGFHDIMCVLLSGHRLHLKMSSDDQVLMKYVVDLLIDIDPEMADRITFVDRLNNADAFVATGSDNTARYFKYYFKDKPNIIRANRTSVAVLHGDESKEQLSSLGDDIFEYYGLGCRNVSKVFVPEGYEFQKLLDALQGYEWVGDHHKYRNNYDYNKSVYLVNREPHLDTGFLLLRQSEQLVSPISVLYYENFKDQAHLDSLLESHNSKIQCVVRQGHISFGQAQSPEVWDYADGVDTMKFLLDLE